MNNSKIIQEIMRLTTNIGTNYPELYHFLDENPETIPNEKHPSVSYEVLSDYLKSLKQQLKNHILSQEKKA
ncbi:MAG: hypothetical protein WDZ35_05630 [Crocinitomicaceae bacterium]